MAVHVISSDSDSEGSYGTEPRYPIRIKLHTSIYKRHIVDVDGWVMRDPQGRPYNVFQPEFNQELETGRIRLIHALYPGYRYFVRNNEQHDRFMLDRTDGGSYSSIMYHVYPDDDFNAEYTPEDHDVTYIYRRTQ